MLPKLGLVPMDTVTGKPSAGTVDVPSPVNCRVTVKDGRLVDSVPLDGSVVKKMRVAAGRAGATALENSDVSPAASVIVMVRKLAGGVVSMVEKEPLAVDVSSVPMSVLPCTGLLSSE